MTPFQLSQSTIDAINAAIANVSNLSGTTDRGVNAAAYRAIYSELVQQNANGNTIAPEVLYWFQHAPEIHEQQTTASAAGTFIWAYTKAAAASEGVTLTNDDLQASSDAIALTVFQTLSTKSFLFDSTDGSEDNFSIAGIIKTDAVAGIARLQQDHPTLDFAVWGGTLFATTNLGYATYFTKFSVDQTPGSRDATAILNGLAGAIAASVQAGSTIRLQGIDNVGNLDMTAINACLSDQQRFILGISVIAAGPDLILALGAAGAGLYIYDRANALLTKLTSDTGVNTNSQIFFRDTNSTINLSPRIASGSGTLELPDGTLITGLPSGLNMKLDSIIAGAGYTSKLTLIDYLTALGSTNNTLAAIGQLHLDQLRPEVNVVGVNASTVLDSGVARVTYSVTSLGGGGWIDSLSAPSTAIVYDAGTASYISVPTYNTLRISVGLLGWNDNVDISQSTITGIQELGLMGGSVVLTREQFNSFSLSAGSHGTYHFTTGGNVSFVGKGITSGFDDGIVVAVADSQDGTTLIGEDTMGLTASLFGDDTLIAGNGGSNALIAGYGADTIVGGTGDDTIVVRAGQLADGTSINGGAGTDTITSYATSSDVIDISRASISNVERLSLSGASVRLKASQLNGFSEVAPASGVLMILAADAGTYDLSSKAVGEVDLTGSDGNDVLIGGIGTRKIIGGRGNDSITFNQFLTTVDGGAGTDTLVVNETIATSVDLELGTFTNYPSTGSILGVENIDGSDASGALNLTGDANANTITGGSANDVIDGGGGADHLDGGAGIDTLIMRADKLSSFLTYQNFEKVEAYGDVSSFSLGGFSTLSSPTGVTVTAAQLGGFSTISPGSIIYAAGSGTYDLSGKGNAGGELHATASTSTTLIADNVNNQTIYASNIGADTISTGNGNGNTVIAGHGVDSIALGTGTTNKIIANFGLASGSSISSANSAGSTLQAEGDISGATISGIGNLQSSTGVTINATQLAGFSLIVSGTHLYAATGGVYDMTGRGTTGDTLEATVNTGTTLIAGGTAGQTLIASEFGHDTLTIGNGDNDVVIAGKGINHITMGTGNNDVIIANDGLAAGSTVLMKNTTTSKLQVNGDISGATITGVNTISSATGVTLTSAQLAGLKFVANNTILYAATGGTYSLTGGRGSFGNQLHATVNTGTTLIAGNAQSMSLYASALGNDTLTIGTGNNDTVYAGGGVNIITMGNGTGDRVIATQGLAAGSSVTMGNTADSLLLAEGDISGATLNGIHTLGSTGGVTLNAAQLNNFATINANTILNAATGGTYDLTGKGDVGGTLRALSDAGTTLIGGAENQTLIASEMGADTLITGNGNNITLLGGNGGNTLTGGSGSNTITGGTGNDVIDGGASSDTIHAGDGNDTVTYDAADISVDGGAGVDTLIVSQATATTIDLSGDLSSALAGFENVDGSASTGALAITGNATANILSGGSGNDTIIGGDGEDSIYGNDGDDTITYHAAATLIDGGSGDDTLIVATGTIVDLNNAVDQILGDGSVTTGFEHFVEAGSGLNILNGDAGANTIQGSSGSDKINGLGGADTIYGNAGNDNIAYDSADVTMDGGADIDTLVLSGATAVTANLTSATDQISGGGKVINFENLDASSLTAAAHFTGSAGDNILIGGSANDSLVGGAGIDSLYGNAGNDTITYDAADNIIDGGAGTDTLVITGANAVTINLATLSDQVSGDAGVTTGFEYVSATAMTGDLILTGDAANNSLRGGLGVNTIDGGAGNDTITGGVSNDTLNGGDGNDNINGGAGIDNISGGAGNDTITYNVNAAVLDGGDGIDTLVLSGSEVVTIDFSNTLHQVSSNGIVTGFEYVNGVNLTSDLTLTGDDTNNNLKGGSGQNTIYGLGGNDTLTGGINVDQLYGGDGNDSMNGGAGADSIYGEAGNDSITYDANDVILDGGDGVDTLVLTGSAALTIDLTSAVNQIAGAATVINFENITATSYTGDLTIFGNDSTNTLRGGSGINTIYGSGSNDSITGGVNNDTLYGGDGNDSMNGGAGADSIFGEAGNDSITYDAVDALIDGGDGVDTLVLTGSAALTIDLSNTANQITGGAVVSNFENITATNYTGDLTITGSDATNTLRGGSGVNAITGGSSNDSITGGVNSDTLYGGDGNDTIVGGLGVDSLYGDAGNDTMTYDANDVVVDGGADVDTLLLTGSAALTIDLSSAANQIAGGATVLNFENITATSYTGDLTIMGSAGGNTLRGGSGVNTITGNASNDSIIGGTNNDVLTGGLGNDSLTGGLGNDTYNFTRGDGADTIVENDATVGNHDVLAFANDVNYDQLWFKQSGNNLIVSVIGSTDKVTVSNWFLGTDRQVESIQAGGQELVNSNVINLVNAMAGMTAPAAGQTTLTTTQHAALDPVIAANWHAA